MFLRKTSTCLWRPQLGKTTFPCNQYPRSKSSRSKEGKVSVLRSAKWVDQTDRWISAYFSSCYPYYHPRVRVSVLSKRANEVQDKLRSDQTRSRGQWKHLTWLFSSRATGVRCRAIRSPEIWANQKRVLTPSDQWEGRILGSVGHGASHVPSGSVLGPILGFLLDRVTRRGEPLVRSALRLARQTEALDAGELPSKVQ